MVSRKPGGRGFVPYSATAAPGHYCCSSQRAPVLQYFRRPDAHVECCPGAVHNGCSCLRATSSNPPRCSRGVFFLITFELLGVLRSQPSDGLRRNRVTFRLINLVFAALFLASAALQYNDEGGVAWAALYFAGTGLDPQHNQKAC